MARALPLADNKTDRTTTSAKRGDSARTRGPQPSGPGRTRRPTVLSDEDVIRFVRRTTRTSDVPVLVEDPIALAQIARVLS